MYIFFLMLEIFTLCPLFLLFMDDASDSKFGRFGGSRQGQGGSSGASSANRLLSANDLRLEVTKVNVEERRLVLDEHVSVCSPPPPPDFSGVRFIAFSFCELSSLFLLLSFVHFPFYDSFLVLLSSRKFYPTVWWYPLRSLSLSLWDFCDVFHPFFFCCVFGSKFGLSSSHSMARTW